MKIFVFINLAIYIIYIGLSHAQVTFDPPPTPLSTTVEWTPCESEIKNHCKNIVAEEEAEKAKKEEEANKTSKDDGFKPVEAMSNELDAKNANTSSTNNNTTTTQGGIDKSKITDRDRAKHDCLSKVVITDLSRECLNHFRSLCSKFDKSCGRRKRMKKK